jgi:hypothetical protein
VDELELKIYLKNHLSITIEKVKDYDNERLEVKLFLDDIKISSDFVTLKSWSD